MLQFGPKIDVISKKKKGKVFRLHMLISQCHFDVPFLSAEANGFLEAHEPPKILEPLGHCPPCPPLSVALAVTGCFQNKTIIFKENTRLNC